MYGTVMPSKIRYMCYLDTARRTTRVMSVYPKRHVTM
jgi:hypothetical protein